MNDGGPAFPAVAYMADRGMSLRDWFAGMALAECQRIMAHEDDYFTSDTCETIAAMTYKMADAMIAERICDQRKKEKD